MKGRLFSMSAQSADINSQSTHDFTIVSTQAKGRVVENDLQNRLSANDLL